MPARTKLTVTAVALLGCLLAAACAPADQNNAAPPAAGSLTPGQGDCAPAKLHTLKANTLTFGWPKLTWFVRLNASARSWIDEDPWSVTFFSSAASTVA